MGMFSKSICENENLGLLFPCIWSNKGLKLQQLDLVVSLPKSYGTVPYLFQILHQARLPEFQVLVYFQKYYSHWYLCQTLEGQKNEWTVH